jgi:hypothetical protein
VLAEEIGAGLVSEFLEVLHTVFSEHVEGVPSLVIKLNALPGHGAVSRRRLVRPLLPQSTGFSVEIGPRKRRFAYVTRWLVDAV